MELKKIFDVRINPSEMPIFFRNFIDEFEKLPIGGGESPIMMFFETGPREGYSTHFKSMGGGYTTVFLQVKFTVAQTTADVLLGFDFQNTGPMGGFATGMMKALGRGVMEFSLSQYIEGAVMKSLRKIQESAK